MPLCNHSRKEVTFKIVYCGTPSAGKTSNLIYIHQKLDPHFRGELLSLNCEQDPTLRFDFLPVKAGRINEYQTRFQLYTVPGQKIQSNTRQVILQGADGIVFVADSSREKRMKNVESLQFTRQALERNRLDPDEIPFVFQYNKRDLPDCDFPEDIDEYLGATAPGMVTCATSGFQVFDTLDLLGQIILKNFHSSAVNGPEQLEEENVASSSKIALSR